MAVCMCPMHRSKNRYTFCSSDFLFGSIGGPKSLNESLIWYLFKSVCPSCWRAQKSSTCFHAWTVVGHSRNKCTSLQLPLHAGHDMSPSLFQYLVWDPI